MKNEIAIAVARVKKKIHSATDRNKSSYSDLFSEVWLSFLLLAGALFGIGAVACLVTALIKIGGVPAFVRGWFVALGG